MNFITDSLTEASVKQKYDILTSKKFANFPSPISFTPNVTGTQQFVMRYFVKKVNEKFIYEVGQQNYNDLMSSTFYNFTSLNWKVRGIEYSVVDSNGGIEGVAEYNQKLIAIAEISIPGITKKLINPLELYQGLN